MCCRGGEECLCGYVRQGIAATIELKVISKTFGPTIQRQERKVFSENTLMRSMAAMKRVLNLR